MLGSKTMEPPVQNVDHIVNNGSSIFWTILNHYFGSMELTQETCSVEPIYKAVTAGVLDSSRPLRKREGFQFG